MQIKIITKNLLAQINGKQVLPIALYGAPGLGKSSLIKQAASDIGAGFLSYAISSTTIEEYTGLPTFVKLTGYEKYSKSNSPDVQGTTWTMPQIIVDANRIAEEKGSCVLLLDDLHTMDQTVTNIMYELLLERGIGDYKLHPKVAIIAAMNHSKESGGGRFHSAAVKSRLRLMEYYFQFEYWYDKFGRFLHPYIASFLSNNQQYVTEQETQTMTPSASARSWTLLSNEFNLYSMEELQDVALQIASGIASPNAVGALDRHIILYNEMNFDQTVKNRVIPNVADIPELKKALWGNIIHSINTPDDAAYLIDLLNQVFDQKHGETIIGFIAQELVTKYKMRERGDEITLGQTIVLDKIVQEYNESKYELTKKQAKILADIDIDKRQEMLTIFSKYL